MANSPYDTQVNKLRLQIGRVLKSYDISTVDGLNMVAECGDVNEVTEPAIYIDKLTKMCVEKKAKMGNMPMRPPTPKKGHSVPNDSEMFKEAAKRHGTPEAKYLFIKAKVYEAVGHHADIATYRRTWDELCKKYAKDEFEMADDKKQDKLFSEDEKPKQHKWTTEETDKYEAAVVDLCVTHNIPSNLLSRFVKDVIGSREDHIKRGKKPADLLDKLNSSAAIWARENVPVDPDLTQSPDLETTLEGLAEATEKLTEVVSQNTQVTHEKSSPAIETASASAIEPEIENQAPTNAADTSNVIEGEIVEDKPAEPGVDEINKLRTDADKLIIATWPDLHGKDKVEGRVAHLKQAWPDCVTTKDALVKYGYEAAMKRVTDYCTEMALKPSALATIPEMNITPITHAPSVRNLKMPTPEEFQMMQTFANAVAKSGLYKEVNTFDKAFVILWKGFELGVGLGAALDGIYIINGRPWPGAQILKAVVMASGQAERFDVICDDTKAVVTVKRKGMDIHVYEFTRDDAAQAKLLGNTTWQNHPKRMMMHRATRMAIVTDFPDLAAGIGIAIDGEDEQDAADVAEQKQIGTAAVAA